MARKRNGNRADDPRLDDHTNRLKLPKALQILSELLKENTPFYYFRGKQILFEALRNEELDCMRESRTSPIKREKVHAPFWLRLGILEKALSSSTSISEKGPRGIFGWDYYVWKPHFDQLRSRIEQNVRAHGERSGSAPAPPLPGPPPQESAPGPSLPDPPPRESAPPAPSSPRQRRRAQGGGMKRKLSDRRIEEAKQFYRDLLAQDPTWTKKDAAAAHLKEQLNLGVSLRTIERRIIDPVLKERLTK